MKFKGQDTFTFFDHLYIELLDLIKETYRSMNGSFQIYDMVSETDGYIDFKMEKGKLHIEGQLGGSFRNHYMCFSFDADQTLLEPLIRAISI